MTNRRDFLKQSSIVAAGTLVAPHFLIRKKPKVLILGAGFSGLAAGYKLFQHDMEFTILEARKRIGGRVFSHVMNGQEEPLTIELGAEWVGASHERLISLCNEFGLELQNNQFDSHLIYKGKYSKAGEWDYSEGWKQKFKSILENYPHLSQKEKVALDKMDWWRFLVNNGIPDDDLNIRELFDSTDFGESIRHVSAFAALAEYAESSEKNEMDYKIKGGNASLATAITNKIGAEKILLDHKVISVSQEGRTIVVTTANGTRFEADALICTLPTYAVSKIIWNPALPKEKTDAINALQYARITKNAFLFSDRFWKAENFDMVTDGPAHYFYHATKNQSNTPKGALISYMIGDKADILSRQSETFRRTQMQTALSPAFGDISDRYMEQVMYYWGEDEYSKGAYAMYGKGQWFGLMPQLKTPVKNIYFAGEHLADWQGFMEGAINTGEEAASSIID